MITLFQRPEAIYVAPPVSPSDPEPSRLNRAEDQRKHDSNVTFNPAATIQNVDTVICLS